MGVGSATLLMINPAFVVSGGFEQDDEAIRLTRLNQMMIAGSLIAGVGLSSLINMGSHIDNLSTRLKSLGDLLFMSEGSVI